MPASFRASAAVVASAALLVSCSSAASTASDTGVQVLSPHVIRTLPHDRDAFTQGLEVHDGKLYESTGLNGSSYVTVSDLSTGEEIRRVELSADFFGEGFTVAGETAWQITWRDGVAFARDPLTLTEQRRVRYEGEGWGLCESADNGLVMSDGTSTLTFRDPVTFDETSRIEVSAGGQSVTDLNELECAEDGSVYANIWQSFDIARIDPTSGAVTAMIDARPLWDALSEDEREGADVLNGIAQIPGTDRFLVTGKLWPTMYEVEFTASK